MSVAKINVNEFIFLSKSHLVVDVRSEGEYLHAHIPSAVSLPLFSNDERKIVGTAYKQQSRKTAIKIGLDYFGKKMRLMVEEVEKLTEEKQKTIGGENSDKIVLVHCWRGGMRSGAVAWLLDMYGFKVYALAGGYKAFRNWVLAQFEPDYALRILGGYTGSGKTYLLHQLEKRGEQVIDLEKLAGHKGSSFGSIGLPAQPSQEMFENMLAMELKERNDGCQRAHYAETADFSKLSSKSIWLEDESRRIGKLNIPKPLWNTIRQKPLYFLNIDFEERLNHIVDEYGKGGKDKLASAIIRIQKRLGGLETKTALNFLIEDNLKECFRVLLQYYDKQYMKGLVNREASAPEVTTIGCRNVSVENAVPLLNAIKF